MASSLHLTGHIQHHAEMEAGLKVADLESRLGLQVALPGLQVILELHPGPCLLVTLAVLLVLLEPPGGAPGTGTGGAPGVPAGSSASVAARGRDVMASCRWCSRQDKH